jgi:hypothetical protein
VEVQPGQKISYTFDTAGIYPYACVLHPGMSGAIVVGDAAGAAAAPGAGTTSGGSTDDSTGGGASAAEAPVAAATEGSGPNGLIVVALGIVAGLVAGAAASWVSLRRRSNPGRLPTPTDSPRPADSTY